jgi:hypothetical protein
MLEEWAKECGQPMPLTRVHLSGGKKLPHYIFRHTIYSLLNLAQNYSADGDYCVIPDCPNNKKGGLHKDEWFSFRTYNQYVIAPPSIHPCGDSYITENDMEPSPIPDWLVDAIRKKGVSQKSKGGFDNAPRVSPKFDFDRLLAWLKVSIAGVNGGYQGTDICPAVGYKHEGQNDVSTAFWWDDEVLGFKCHAQGCPSNMERLPNEGGIGCLMRLMQRPEAFGPYDGEIWPRKSMAEMGFLVEDANEAEDFSAKIPETSDYMDVGDVKDIMRTDVGNGKRLARLCGHEIAYVRETGRKRTFEGDYGSRALRRDSQVSASTIRVVEHASLHRLF